MPARLNIDDALAAQAAVLSVSGVASMHAGRHGEVAMLYPHERVVGLKPLHRGGADGLEVHVVADISAGRNLNELADDVRHQVQTVTGMSLIDVTVGDISESFQPDNTPA
ncbi:hypothetical protein QP027_01385 [Corynebacterium breve]|uniref:Asp23/Gls24 family envelope stress response protein n=1 Tax=Corynebacterium breve TaxID=3049799 RepID=A0ABY8VHF8_9CORY|nr:hypothetical protein [Corynebacterium breve]WIM68078.1 hypothetical protein QP027_01385 [Corynebacterium breve]